MLGVGFWVLDVVLNVGLKTLRFLLVTAIGFLTFS
jgi:hypothetical protein